MSEFGGSSTSSTSSPSAGRKLTKWRAQADEVEIGREHIGWLKAQEGACRTGFSVLRGSAANGFAGDAVAVAVHLDAIARLAGVQRSLAECADLFAARVDGALLDRSAGVGRACFA